MTYNEEDLACLLGAFYCIKFDGQLFVVALQPVHRA